MKNGLERLSVFVRSVAEKSKFRKGIVTALVAFLALQAYFVRELLAAELLFGFVFAVLLLISAGIYLTGVIGERGLVFAEVGVRVVAESARRSYALLEEISRKPFRHPRSESAQ